MYCSNETDESLLVCITLNSGSGLVHTDVGHGRAVFLNLWIRVPKGLLTLVLARARKLFKGESYVDQARCIEMDARLHLCRSMMYSQYQQARTKQMDVVW